MTTLTGSTFSSRLSEDADPESCGGGDPPGDSPRRAPWLTRPAAIMFALAILIVAAGLLWGPGGSDVPIDGDVEVVNMQDIVPIYGDQPITWDMVEDLRTRGLAAVSFVYMDDTGNYARVFDDKKQLHAWTCSRGAPDYVRPASC